MLNDYDMRIYYHQGKANVVPDALKRLSMGGTAHLEEENKELAKDVHRLAHLEVQLMDSIKGVIVVANRDESSLFRSERDISPRFHFA